MQRVQGCLPTEEHLYLIYLNFNCIHNYDGIIIIIIIIMCCTHSIAQI